MSRYAALFHQEFAGRLRGVSVAQVESTFVALDERGYRPRDEVYAGIVKSLQWDAEPDVSVVRFMKAMIQAHRWLYANKELAVDFLVKEMKLKPAYARKGWEHYTENQLWHPDGDVTLEGLKYNIQIYSEQTQSKGPPLTPAKYVDQSYLKEALKQLAVK